MVKTVSLLALCLLVAAPACAAEPVNNPSHLPIPRFAALRSGKVNMRTGPGMRYPIEWVYTRKGLPVEVVAEYDIWRRVRDPEGSEGWVNKTEITGRRGLIVTGGTRELRNDADAKASIAAHLETGATGHLVACAPNWCKAEFGDIKGYLRKTEFWGAYPNETFD